MMITLRYAIKCGLPIDSLSLSSSVDSDPPRSLEVISKSGQGKMLAMLVCTATPLLAFHSKWPSMNLACAGSESAMRCVHVWPWPEDQVSSPSFHPLDFILNCCANVKVSHAELGWLSMLWGTSHCLNVFHWPCDRNYRVLFLLLSAAV